MNIRFIDGIKKIIFKVWHVKVVENGSQNWSNHNSIFLDVYISKGIAILVNSSPNSNLRLRHLSENLKRS